MFRTLIYPSAGACDNSVELPHWSYCSWFDACWSSMDTTPTQHTPNHDQCGNLTEYAQAPVDGYISVRNMLST